MANGADPLAEFYVATARQSPGLTGRSGVHGQVDGLLGELRVPAEIDKDGDWKLTTDVGPFLLIVDKEDGDLVALQTIQPMEKVRKASEEMYVLLALNFQARGLARFGTVKDAGQDLLVLTARLAPETISREALEGMLGDCFRLSRRVDELLGNEPPQAPAQPGGWQAADAALAHAETGGGPPPGQAAEPPGADQPPAEAPAAATIFAQPVPGGAASGAAGGASPGAAAGSGPAPAPAEPGPAPGGPAQGGALDFPPPAVADPGPAAPGPAQPEPSYPPPAAPEPSYPPPAMPEPVQQYPPPQPPVALPAADWYPDPYYQARLRYWDGQAWTQHVAN